MTEAPNAHDPRHRLARAAGVACLLSTFGCYHYAVVPPNELAPAMEVRVELSAVGVDRIRQGPDSLAKLLNGFNVSGTVSRLAGDSVLLSVPTSYMEANVRLKTQMHELALLRSELQSVRLRQLDRARTTWVGAGLGAAAALSAAYALNWGGRSKGSTTKPIDPVDTRIPVVSAP
jgi:hypothetical protein